MDEGAAGALGFTLVSFSLRVYGLRRVTQTDGYKLAVTNAESIYRGRGVQRWRSLWRRPIEQCCVWPVLVGAESCAAGPPLRPPARSRPFLLLGLVCAFPSILTFGRDRGPGTSLQASQGFVSWSDPGNQRGWKVVDPSARGVCCVLWRASSSPSALGVAVTTPPGLLSPLVTWRPCDHTPSPDCKGLTSPRAQGS